MPRHDAIFAVSATAARYGCHYASHCAIMACHAAALPPLFTLFFAVFMLFTLLIFHAGAFRFSLLP